MKNIKRLDYILMSLAFVMLTFTALGQKKKSSTAEVEVINLNTAGKGLQVEIEFKAGPEHNHPMMAVWIEDEKGNYIQTLFVNESVAKGYFKHADNSSGKWQPGELVRPASLPVWAHKRGVENDIGNYMPTQNQPVADAYSGATPAGDFQLITKSDEALPQKFKILFEINQSWDWNEYWTNNKFPDDEDYKSSSQPSLVYAVNVDLDNEKDFYDLIAIGHGHYSGENGEINEDLINMTTALEIVGKVSVKVK